MGQLIETRADPATHTPAVFSNATGYCRWGGKHADDLTSADLEALRRWCLDEGWRQGWNHADQQLGGWTNPFDPVLLDGWPHKAWAESFADGGYARKHKQRNSQ